jgi:hypothetical protein
MNAFTPAYSEGEICQMLLRAYFKFANKPEAANNKAKKLMMVVKVLPVTVLASNDDIADSKNSADSTPNRAPI